jgi:hypothetical protein
MTALDVLGLMLTVVATIGMLTWCLELERRATESPQRDDNRTPIYLLGCEYWIALEVPPALAGHRREDVVHRGGAA